MYSKFETIFSRVTQAACTFFLAAIFVMFLLNVFVRFVPIYNFTQTDDWIQFCLIWMIFLAAAELVRTKNHFVVDVATSQIASPAVKRWMCVAVLLIELVTCVVICLVWRRLGDALERPHAVDPLDGGALCLPGHSGGCLLHGGLRREAVG